MNRFRFPIGEQNSAVIQGTDGPIFRVTAWRAQSAQSTGTLCGLLSVFGVFLCLE